MTAPTRTEVWQERRSLTLAQAGIQVRADNGGAERFTGLAVPFGVRAPIGNPKTWGFFEEFAPGSGTKTLQEGDQRLLIDHDTFYVVSRVSAGTLALAQSARGVEVDSALDEALSYVSDLKANVRNGNITGMSIGFTIPAGKDSWSQIEVEEEAEDGKIRVYTADLRTVHEFRLLEVSAVSFPAFVDTEAALRFAVVPALTRRGDHEAIARRAEHRPELQSLLDQITREPAPATRGGNDPEPAPATRLSVASIDRLMRGHATRRRLPLPPPITEE